MRLIYKALTIAGSDSGGGAGIQADIKTFQEMGVYGMSAITAVTAQNTSGVQAIYPMTVEAVSRQIASVADDLGTDAIKTGMLHNREIMEAVADKIKKYCWVNVVIDPVLTAKGGTRLLAEDALRTLITRLIPLAKVITPNIPEAETLTGAAILSWSDRQEAAKKIHAMGAAYVVLKGGHDRDERCAKDLLYDGRTFVEFTGKRVHSKHTHGTGCTYSAAIAAELAKGRAVEKAVRTAKQYIQAAIENAPGIGNGHGPLNHWACRLRSDIPYRAPGYPVTRRHPE